MCPIVYETAKWIGLEDRRFIYSHALNRKLNQEEHSHEFFEIIYLFAGSAEHKVNGSVQAVDAGDVTLLRPGDAHLFTSQSAGEFELYSISVVSDELMRFLKAYQLESQLVYVSAPVVFHLNHYQLNNLLRCFRQLSQLPSQTEKDALIRVIIGTTLQYYLLQSLEKSRDWFQSILLQMKQPQNMAAGVPAMMRIANLSHAQLCRTMKRMNLQTPRTYIKELRLSTAYEMIQNTSTGFDDIALQVGYASMSHFSREFKLRFGLSPSALRKNSESYLI